MKYYTAEKNTQMLIALMKTHGIKKIIVSPGATNVCFVGSVQNDPFFELYSSVDERSAAYIACGLAAESGEPVALSCTGATASRNYIPGLTEAYYRQLPVLAITSTQHTGKVGNYTPQVIDRSVPLNDIVKYRADIPTINSVDDEWSCNVKINKALLALTNNGRGPVHINLTTSYSKDFSVKELPQTRGIKKINYHNPFPELKQKARTAVFVGAHLKWDDELIAAVDSFCERYNGVVFCDRIANYYGKYRVNPCVVGNQIQYRSPLLECDVMIHIGNVSGTDNHMGIKPKSVWRVNEDGEIRDTFRRLHYVFEMKELDFFKKMVQNTDQIVDMEYYSKWCVECSQMNEKMPELPFSNAWIAQNTLNRFSENSVIHFGILNSLRSWSYFETDKRIFGYCNTGGFGIDGCISSLAGASLSDRSKIYYGIVGDLAFFYDMNVIGNRHVGSNFRLMIINNGRGQEFRNSLHHAAQFGSEADLYMAAAGHYGKKSPELIKHFAEDLGYEYFSAYSKEEYLQKVDCFTAKEMKEKPVIFEVFTDTEKESESFDIIHNIEKSSKESAKQMAKKLLGDKGVKILKKMIKS